MEFNYLKQDGKYFDPLKSMSKEVIYMAMNLVPYEPVSLISELNTLMENVVQRSMSLDETKVATSQWLPTVDIKEEVDHFLLTADLPGVDPNDIDVSMENNVLIIQGKRNTTQTKDTGTYF